MKIKPVKVKEVVDMAMSLAAPKQYQLRVIIERAVWDQFIAEQVGGHLLQSWGWGELKATAGWRPVRLALWEGERIVAAAQVLCKGVPRVPLWAGHLAYIPKGPVLDWSEPELCREFFVQLHSYLRRRGAIALRIEPMQEVDSSEGKLALSVLEGMDVQQVHAVQPLRTIVLDVQADEERLLGQMKEKWRYNVRLAGRKGVKIRVAEHEEDVEAWYGLLQATGERDSFGIHTLDYYKSVWRFFVLQGQMRLLLAEYEGQLLAGIFVGRFGQQGIYLYGASSNEQRQLMPNYLLQWEAIRWAKEGGATAYDFWGIPETDAEEEAMAGVYRFKRGWGGRVVQFVGCYEQVYQPLLMKVANRFL